MLEQTNLVDPTPESLASAVSALVRAANKGCRRNLLADPPPGFDRFHVDHRQQPEGVSFWLSQPGAKQTRTCTRLALAWWTDQAGRRHYRIAGARGETPTVWRMTDLLAGQPTDIPALLRFDSHAFYRTREGSRELAVLCPCGVFGPPRSIGWMKDRCGPCHDRAEAGSPPAPRLAWLHQGPDWSARCLAFSPDGARLAVGGNDGLQLFDVATGASQAAEIGRDHCLAIAFSPDGETLAVGRNGHALLLDVSAGQARVKGQLQSPFAAHLPIWDVIFSPAGDRLFARSVVRSSYRLVIWDLATGQHHLPQPDLEFCSMALSSDGRTLALSDFRERVHILDAASGERQATLTFPDHPRNVAFVPGQRLLACCILNSTRVSLIDVDSHKVARTYPEPACNPGMSAWNLAISPDGGTFLSSNWSMVQGRDASTGARVRLDFPDESLCDLAVSPTGSHAAVSSYRGTLHLLPMELLCADGRSGN